MPTDVTDPASMKSLADAAWDHFGSVQVLCLNAGVISSGHAWEATDDDWDWVLGVNVRGVSNGIRAFVPEPHRGPPTSAKVGDRIDGRARGGPGLRDLRHLEVRRVFGLAESLHHDLALSGPNTSPCRPSAPAWWTPASVMAAEIVRRTWPMPPTPTVPPSRGPGCETCSRVRWIHSSAPTTLDQAFAGRFYCTTHAGDMWQRQVGIENDDRLAGRPPRFQMYE